MTKKLKNIDMLSYKAMNYVHVFSNYLALLNPTWILFTIKLNQVGNKTKLYAGPKQIYQQPIVT